MVVSRCPSRPRACGGDQEHSHIGGGLLGEVPPCQGPGGLLHRDQRGGQRHLGTLQQQACTRVQVNYMFAFSPGSSSCFHCVLPRVPHYVFPLSPGSSTLFLSLQVPISSSSCFRFLSPGSCWLLPLFCLFLFRFLLAPPLDFPLCLQVPAGSSPFPPLQVSVGSSP